MKHLSEEHCAKLNAACQACKEDKESCASCKLFLETTKLSSKPTIPMVLRKKPGSKGVRLILFNDGNWWTVRDIVSQLPFKIGMSAICNRISKNGIYAGNILSPPVQRGYNAEGTAKNPGKYLRNIRAKGGGIFSGLSNISRSKKLAEMPEGTMDRIIKCPPASTKDYKDIDPVSTELKRPSYKSDLAKLKAFNVEHASPFNNIWEGGI